MVQNVENSKAVPQEMEKKELPSDSAILLLGICPKALKARSWDIYTHMFTKVLFTTTKRWKQPICSLTDEMNKENGQEDIIQP